MKHYDSTKIKNIAVAGHAGSGKTSLVEALLFKAGVTDRLGKVADGNTVSDYNPEEIKRKSSIYTSLTYYERDDLKVNLLDTPGMFDYAGAMTEGIFASGCVMITVSGKSGVKVGTEKAYDCAVELKKPRMFVVTKLDDDNANFNNVLTDLKAKFGPTVCPIVVPIIKDSKIVSYVNLIEMKNYEYNAKGEPVEIPMPDGTYRIDGLVEAVSEAVAETDEALFEKFFSGEKFTQKEIIDGIHKGMNEGIITPVTCVSSTTLAGVDMLLKEINLLMPAPAEKEVKPGVTADEDIIEVACDENAPVCAFVFKTVADPFVGKMSYIKVFAGKLESGAEIVNATTGATEKVGKLVAMCGKKQEEVDAAYAGDIVVASKMNVNTNDTLCASSRVCSLEKIEFPQPCYPRAVKTKQGDESKISGAMARILEEDKTLQYYMDPTTKEMILKGMGEQHLVSACAKLKVDFGADVELCEPKIAYKETIRKKVKVQGKHKKQSGGHGQYGDVWIEFEPCVSDELIFEERVFGGVVPRNFFPAVEKGLQECTAKGVLAGFPVVGLKAILVDGSYHPVDSSEMAFKIAASLAYKEGLRQAEPILLEPIGSLSVTVSDDNTGDMMGDLNKRRGRVLGMNPSEKKGLTEIVAEVPMSEMHDFAMTVRQMTQGRGFFTFELVRYEPLPSQLVGEVIAKAGNIE